MTTHSGFYLKDIAYTTNHKLILQGISFDISPGQYMGILGPNGAGKSTLLRLMAATLSASAGTVLLDGRALRHWPAHERAQRLAFVPQRIEQMFPFCVREIVRMGRTPYLRRWQREGEEDERIVAEAMTLTDIMHLAEQDVTTLSSGELQRVAIARALAQRPAFLLLDEPTANLDLHHQLEILDALTRLVHNGTTVLATLHDLNLAATYCSTVILLRNGEVVAAGSPAEVLTAQTVRAVFDVEVFPSTHPQTGTPYLIPLTARARRNEADLPSPDCRRTGNGTPNDRSES
ncbi:MAG: heme ABC transporter ATP-binding protein [Deltaproteobacteria bacterium]|nr:heme ABC transporter ATP-binding protein [Deltaproteobacteria bacterium]